MPIPRSVIHAMRTVRFLILRIRAVWIRANKILAATTVMILASVMFATQTVVIAHKTVMILASVMFATQTVFIVASSVRGRMVAKTF